MNPKNLLLILSSCSLSLIKAAYVGPAFDETTSTRTPSFDLSVGETNETISYDGEEVVPGEDDGLLDGFESSREAFSEMPSSALSIGLDEGKLNWWQRRRLQRLSQADPRNISVQCSESIALMPDTFADQSSEEEFKALHERSLAKLNEHGKAISFDWIYHLAHLNDFADVFASGRADKVKSALRKLMAALRVQENRFVNQKAHVEDLFTQVVTGKRSEKYKKTSDRSVRIGLARQFRILEDYAAGYAKVKQQIYSAEFVQERMAAYEEQMSK